MSADISKVPLGGKITLQLRISGLDRWLACETLERVSQVTLPPPHRFFSGADESGEWQGVASMTSRGPCGRPRSSGRVPAGLPHGRLDSHRDTLSSSALPPAPPGWADPTANFENEKSRSRPQMSIFFWRFDSPVISAWSPKNLRNVALIMKIGTWPRWADALIGTGPPHLQLPLPGWAAAFTETVPVGPGPVSTSLRPAAWQQHQLLRKARVLMNVWLPVRNNKTQHTLTSNWTSFSCYDDYFHFTGENSPAKSRAPGLRDGKWSC